MKDRRTLACALALVAAPAIAGSFAAHDADEDGRVSRDEYYDHVSDAGLYPHFDRDGDGFVETREFATFSEQWDVDEWNYDGWDRDDDALIDSGEFYEGWFGYYDRDDDGALDIGEWEQPGLLEIER